MTKLAALLLGSPASGCCGWRPNDRFFILSGRSSAAAPASGRGCAPRTAASPRSGPAIARWSILNEPGIRTDSVAGAILLAGVPIILAILQGGVVHLDDGVLLAR